MQFKVFCNVEFLALAGRRLQNKNEVQLKTNQKCKLVFGSVWVNCLPSTASRLLLTITTYAPRPK